VIEQKQEILDWYHLKKICTKPGVHWND
jgi:hypothetical protein